MQKALNLAALVLTAISLVGCGVLQKITHPFSQGGSAGMVMSLSPYSGPKARLAVADFELRSPRANTQISAGLREMLVSALAQSKRFAVIDPKALVVKTGEPESSGSQDKPNKSVPVKERKKAAGLIVTATLTEFEPVTSGGRDGVGGGGGAGSGILGGLLGSRLNKAHIALDIRIADSSTSKVLAARNIQAQASDISGGLMTGFSGSWGLDNNLSIYANTPTEKALRICILETVRYISDVVPGRYYEY